MNCDTPSPTPHSTNDVEASPRTPENNAVEVVPSKSIKDCTWTDILVSAEETNPCVKKPSKNTPVSSVPCSRLVSIGNIPALSISLDDLRKFARKINITNTRRMKKIALCHAIVAAKGRHDVEVANGTAEVVDPKTNSPIRFITIRF